MGLESWMSLRTQMGHRVPETLALQRVSELHNSAVLEVRSANALNALNSALWGWREYQQGLERHARALDCHCQC